MTAVYDIETYPNICTFVFRELTKERELKIFEISSRKNQLSELILYLKTPGLVLVGYNSIEFDYPILHFILKNPNCTLNQIYKFGKVNKLCLEDSIIKIIEKGEFKPKIKTSLNQLINMIHKWRKDNLNLKHYDLLKLVLDESGYSAMLKNKKDLENENRLENLKELLRAMQDYENFMRR